MNACPGATLWCNSVKVPNGLAKRIYQFTLRSYTLPHIMWNTVKKKYIYTSTYVKVSTAALYFPDVKLFLRQKEKTTNQETYFALTH